MRVSQTLNLCAQAMIDAGRLGIFTPMYFIHARKPEQGLIFPLIWFDGLTMSGKIEETLSPRSP